MGSAQTTGRDEDVLLPKCPDPAHANGRVARAGWHGRPPHRRQRWVVSSGERRPEASVHRKELTRHEARRARTALTARLCSTPWEGQAGATQVRFNACDIGQALNLVAAGSSYRQAAQTTRLGAARGDRRHVVAPASAQAHLPARWPVGGQLRLCVRPGGVLRPPRQRHVLAPLSAQPQTHPVWQRYERPLFSVSEWDAFVHAVAHEDAYGTALLAAMRVVGMHGARIREQAANRCARGPYSTGSVEAVNRKHADEFLGTRATRLGNRARTIRLLDLLTVGLNRHASQRSFSKAVRLYREGHGGRPQLHQRPHDDLKGAPSLFA